ncbi:MAG TPA: mercuric reductase [Gemmatimonas sp.]|nr:mercuric reductase [Gemmatimonas sp.]
MMITSTTALPAGTILADDGDDQRLVGLVHPDGWQNPAPRGRYHLVVIGAGTGGLVTAAAAAGLGARVALVERHLMGGDCLNVGCVPSKAIIRAARAWHEARHAAARFGGPSISGDGDFAEAFARMRRLRADLAPIDSAERFKGLGIDVFLGDARFADAGSIDVGGQRLHFRRAVIATGARAATPDIPGLAGSGFHTNETIFSLRARPDHLLIIGAGPIGCELAQAFVRLGTRVTLLAREGRVLPRDTADASVLLAAALERDGVTLVRDASVTRVTRVTRAPRGAESDAGQAPPGDITLTVRRNGREFEVRGDTLLVAVGRAPNVEGMGLEAAGVDFDSRKGVAVDDRLRTTNGRVYAVGDVCSPHKLTHAADFQARLVVQNALFFGRGKASALVTPWVTYTDPEVAGIGHTEHTATESGVEVDIIDVPMHDVDRARLDDATEGFCRVLVARGSDRIVGASIVSAHAGEHVGAVALAMTNGLGLGAFGHTMHPYPTQSEMLRKAADAWRRRKLTPTVKSLFARYFRVLR